MSIINIKDIQQYYKYKTFCNRMKFYQSKSKPLLTRGEHRPRPLAT